MRVTSIFTIVDHLADVRHVHANAGFNGVCRRIAGREGLLERLVEVLIALTARSHFPMPTPSVAFRNSASPT
jgi:hypothetical protein